MGKPNATHSTQPVSPARPGISKNIYAAIGNCRRTSLIVTGPEIGVATLKNITTLILSAPYRHVGDAYKIRRFTMIFFTKMGYEAYCVQARNRCCDS